MWEQHEEAVDVQMRTHIPVFTEDVEREITAVPGGAYNFLLEGDNLHSLRLLEKTHRGQIDLIYIDPPYNTGGKDFVYNDANGWSVKYDPSVIAVNQGGPVTTFVYTGECAGTCRVLI